MGIERIDRFFFSPIFPSEVKWITHSSDFDFMPFSIYILPFNFFSVFLEIHGSAIILISIIIDAAID